MWKVKRMYIAPIGAPAGLIGTDSATAYFAEPHPDKQQIVVTLTRSIAGGVK